MKLLNLIAVILVLVGAINWGFIGLLGFNVVGTLLAHSILANIVYIAVGVSGVWVIIFGKDMLKGLCAK